MKTIKCGTFKASLCAVGVVFLLWGLTYAWASFQGEMMKAGIFSDGTNLTIPGNISVGGEFVGAAVHVVDYGTTTSAYTVLTTQKGFVFEMTEADDNPVTFNLPIGTSLEIGDCYTFIDTDLTAAADLTINPNDADSINGDTAGDAIYSNADAVQAITLMWNGTMWVTLYSYGTWTAA